MAELPPGTRLKFFIRHAADLEALEARGWHELSQNGLFDLAATHRFVQYRAIFLSDNGDRFPILDEVQIRFLK